MIAGRVVGSLWATRKDEKLNGLTFLIVETFFKKEGTADYFVAADNAGAGVNDLVLVSKGGAARASLDNPKIPVDAVIVGVIDSIDVENE